MKNNIVFSIILVVFFCKSYSQDTTLKVVKSTTFEETNELYSSSIESYKQNEFWGIWSVPVGEGKASYSLPSVNGLDYSYENLEDYDLNTAWMVPNFGIGQYLEFKIDLLDDDIAAYQFQGITNLFNGYCKSLALWKANSRVKRLKVYLNDVPLCYVDLVDTWHFQSFDISKYLQADKLQNVPKSNNCVRFEIVDIYKGTKYKDVGFSEFLCEGAGN